VTADCVVITKERLRVGAKAVKKINSKRKKRSFGFLRCLLCTPNDMYPL